VAAIPELIDDGVTGALVAPEDPTALAAALARLIADPAERRRLGQAGQQRIRADFDMKGGIDTLARLLSRTGGVDCLAGKAAE
jgi:glycosyltransferase involved in cell wall biosynthesis